MDCANLHPYNIEMRPFEHSSKDLLLDLLRTTYNDLNPLNPNTDIESFNITQNVWF